MQSRIAFDTHLKIALTEYWSGGEEEAISNSNKKSVGRGIFIKGALIIKASKFHCSYDFQIQIALKSHGS